MKVGDLVRCHPEDRVGIIVDWYVVYDRYGEPVEKLAVVNWDSSGEPEHEYPGMLEVVK